MCFLHISFSFIHFLFCLNFQWDIFFVPVLCVTTEYNDVLRSFFFSLCTKNIFTVSECVCGLLSCIYKSSRKRKKIQIIHTYTRARAALQFIMLSYNRVRKIHIHIDLPILNLYSIKITRSKKLCFGSIVSAAAVAVVVAVVVDKL